uniref:Uncharacterized protein n=1 Tax=Podoviridae sp. cthau23 TaxID=2825268 RepID=A0A8S5U748_9CAUD|nr:MAG TPA: hypothetical protein [Podoviridae sp. cthau23]
MLPHFLISNAGLVLLATSNGGGDFEELFLVHTAQLFLDLAADNVDSFDGIGVDTLLGFLEQLVIVGVDVGQSDGLNFGCVGGRVHGHNVDGHGTECAGNHFGCHNFGLSHLIKYRTVWTPAIIRYRAVTPV